MEFVAAVSHELRTPLAVICSAGENLADGIVADAPQVKRYGALIQTEGQRLDDMIERVLAFAGIGAGTTAREHADVDVRRLLREVVDRVRSDAADRGVAITLDAAAQLPPVTGEPDALRSALINIVGNALKYSARGGRVDISASAAVGATPAVDIRVADAGLGIDAAELPHIFKPFYRGRRAVDAQVRGTGIGLSVVKHVIDAHRGAISIESRVGQGTTVVVHLPAALPDVSGAARAPESAA
jgi:signal transduction histidine kinase